MDDRFNTAAGWALFAGIVALGLASLSNMHFGANKPHRPETMGYEIEGVVSSEGGDAAVPLPNLLAAADIAKGEQVYAKCRSCHTIDNGGANGLGPNLYAVMGKPHGVHPGFAFSDAVKSIPGTWTFESMNEWLTNPKKYAPGTKMTFAGISSAEDRAALMLYINAQGSNLPLPAPVAEAAASAAEGEAGAEASEAAAVPSEADSAAPAN